MVPTVQQYKVSKRKPGMPGDGRQITFDTIYRKSRHLFGYILIVVVETFDAISHTINTIITAAVPGIYSLYAMIRNHVTTHPLWTSSEKKKQDETIVKPILLLRGAIVNRTYGRHKNYIFNHFY